MGYCAGECHRIDGQDERSIRQRDAFIKFAPIPIDGKHDGNFEMEMRKVTLVEYENEKIGGHLKDLNQGAPQLR